MQQAPAERRDQILTAASDVFAEHGIHRSRIDDIAAAAGVSKGTVYWYFPSKDEIVFALVEAFLTRAHTGLVELLEAPGTVAERLRGYLSSYAPLLEEHRHLGPLAVEFYALAPRQERVRESLERYYAQWADALATLLEQGNAHGEFRITDTARTARTLVELFDGAFLVWTVVPEAVDLNERMQRALDLLYHGLAGDTGTAGK
ncbi:TetR family transcriptional regulator [Haloactinospora alba]|uniref:TetR family transcriptional regulator n=1 Tax=Haloactinospora alba TaxID=405555 RepID=A0A543N9S0_9ACTN|nr:TetR/AcrR family transcriptional regulator [Haloactinospora alba]TQN28540.1 TetR family transcriptional regulator [Haloactinospora alba]